MKVLMVNEFEHYGGAEVHVATLTDFLTRLGHEVRLTTMRQSREDEVKPGGHYSSMAAAVKGFKPDVIHFHNMRAMLKDLAWAIGVEYPHILSLHDYWPFCYERMMVLNQIPCQHPCRESCHNTRTMGTMRKELAQAAMKVVTFNPSSAAIFADHGINCLVIPHGIDIEAFKPAPKKQVKVVFLSSRQGYWVKGQHFFDAAVQGMEDKVIRLVGASHEEVKQALATSLVFMHTGLYQETFGLTVVEAMASGCAVISSDVAGTRSTITPGTGILVQVGDVNGMRVALRQLFADPRRAVELGVAARKHAEVCYNGYEMAERYVALYQSVLQKKEQEACRA